MAKARGLSIALTAIALITVGLGTGRVRAEGWLPNLNPFAAKPTRGPVERTSYTVGDKPSGGMSLPKLGWPKLGWGQQQPKGMQPWRPKQPTTWQKLNRGTRNFLNQAGATLNPWSSSADSRPGVTTGNRRTYPGSPRMSRNKSNNSGGLFGSWFAPKPEPKKIRSVNDWLKLPRPSDGAGF